MSSRFAHSVIHGAMGPVDKDCEQTSCDVSIVEDVDDKRFAIQCLSGIFNLTLHRRFVQMCVDIVWTAIG